MKHGNVEILERKKLFKIDDILQLVGIDIQKSIILDDCLTEINNLRLFCFKEHGTICSNCRLPAEYFALERVRSPNFQGWALNLYGNKDGREIYFTKDHIIPRSKKGSDELENLQTMCWPCNQKKGDKMPTRRRNPDEHFDVIIKELTAFSQTYNLRNLADRVRRGLDPIGILALSETRELVTKLIDLMRTSYDEVLKMALEIQTGGPWDYATRLSEANLPYVKVWIILNAANTMGKEREMDLTPKEFIEDLDRIKSHLRSAIDDPQEFFKIAKQHVLKESRKGYRLTNGVPISELDNGFLLMAINGYHSGITQDADGMLFVGAKRINTEALERWGLISEVREDRGRKIPFYLNPSGDALIKLLYPGFAIILSRSFPLAIALAKASAGSSVEISQDILGHTLYRPTSAKEESSTQEDPIEFLFTPTIRNLEIATKIWGPLVVEETQKAWFGQGKDLEDEFYLRMAEIKGKVIFLDMMEGKIKKRIAEGKPSDLTIKDIKKQISHIKNKRLQKIEEIRYIIDVMKSMLDILPDKVNIIQDMAGGAGDLGLAVGFYLLKRSHPLQQIQIIDPFSKRLGLDSFMEHTLRVLPMGKELAGISVHTNETLQEARIPSNALVVAKHACGDLTDSIIEKWVDSQSLALGILTCCQDKAAEQPARYDIHAPQDFLVINCGNCGATNAYGQLKCIRSILPDDDCQAILDPNQEPHPATAQEYWEWLCHASAQTNSKDVPARDSGMMAMTILDKARIHYLRRYGFDAGLFQTDKFPKGDAIVARRII